MANDQHMIEALSDMLQDGETLIHPIFGYIKNGGFQQFAYFGFTETCFLIAYLSGEHVTDTARMALDITSVKITKTKLLKEYTINIVFNQKQSYTISAFPKILKIKLQEENFPLFLEHLKSKAKKQDRTLDEIDGENISI